MNKFLSLMTMWLVSTILILNHSYDEFSVIAIFLSLAFTGLIIRYKHKYIYFSMILINLVAAYYFPMAILYYPMIILVIENELIKKFLLFSPYILFGFYIKNHVAEIIILGTLYWILYYKDILYEEVNTRYNNYFSESRKLQDNLKYLNKELQQTQNEGISMALLEERNRIARDIHDGVGHTISRGILQVGAMIVSSKDNENKENLENLNKTLKSSMEQLRKSVHNLVEDRIDLKSSIEEIVSNFKFCNIDYHYSITTKLKTIYLYSIIFIVKESLNNISKHSNATNATLSFRESEDYIFLLIKDNGKSNSNMNYGMGIYSISNRVKQMNGSLDISTENGFRIFITIPKKDVNIIEDTHNWWW